MRIARWNFVVCLCALCFKLHIQAGGSQLQCPVSASLHLRGGSSATAAEMDSAAPATVSVEAQKAASDAEKYMKEQLDFWNGLTPEQQAKALESMTPQERTATEALLAGKPQLTVTKESLAVWNSLTPEEQAEQLARMTPEQQEAIKLASEGTIAAT